MSPAPVPAPVGSPTKPKSANGTTPKPTPQPAGKTSAKTSTVGVPGISSGIIKTGERIGIYGPGGIGKTELVAGVASVGLKPLFIDLDCGTFGLDVDRAAIDGELASSFDEIRQVLHNPKQIEPFDLICVDTFTTGEDRIREWVIANVPHEKGKPIERIEDYGWGKGFSHIFEAGLLILQDLEAIARRGKHVAIVCHQCTEKVPSAETEDYIEYQPRLQSPPKSGKLRERVFEWCGFFFRIDQDRAVTDGKVTAGGNRVIHTTRTPTAWAKHRTLSNGRELPDIIPFPKGDVTLWETMFAKD